jgi:drug/metabolite transporter (DMT)-like permease
MIFVFLIICILVHTLIGVVFKYFEKHKINNLKAIIVNYLVSVAVAWIFCGEFPLAIESLSRPWFLYALGLGGFMIFGFTFSALCFQYLGLAFTIVIQKMSLVIPVTIAIILFNESASWFKIAGIFAALFSIILINMPITFKLQLDKRSYWMLIWIPLLTFVIGGIIETSLLVINENNMLQKGEDVTFVASLFFIAAIFGLLFLTISSPFVKREPWKKRDLFGGLVLGSFNFFSIYLLLWLLGEGMDGSIMYPLNNIGVVALSAIIGYFLFKEKLNSWKLAGLAFAFLSIVLILLAETS